MVCDKSVLLHHFVLSFLGLCPPPSTGHQLWEDVPHSVKNCAAWHPDSIRILGPSRVAALNTRGGLFIPINNFFPELAGSQLVNIHISWEGVYFVIIDRKSMARHQILAMTDQQLC